MWDKATLSKMRVLVSFDENDRKILFIIHKQF